MAVSPTPPVTTSSHVSEKILEPFLQADFNAADYLNSTLPSLSIGSQNASSRAAPKTGVSLTDFSSQTQTLLSQLNAQASRLTAVLTQLTDDIIRSGGRLSYEVDVLRGESTGLSEVVSDGLKDEISLFVKSRPDGDTPADEQPGPEQTFQGESEPSPDAVADPQYISQLRMLTNVRQRLDSVIKTFGEAMQWTLPPSEVSIASSFISVSAPEPGADSQSREQKGREFSEKLRTEIADLILSQDGVRAGFEAAEMRIDALKELAQLWKGTAEEKARIRFVENLAKLAEDRLKELEKGDNFKRAKAGRGKRVERGAGFLENLHNLRSTQ